MNNQNQTSNQPKKLDWIKPEVQAMFNSTHIVEGKDDNVIEIDDPAANMGPAS